MLNHLLDVRYSNGLRQPLWCLKACNQKNVSIIEKEERVIKKVGRPKNGEEKNRCPKDNNLL